LSFTAISLYGQWEEVPGGGAIYSCARLHRMISDLTGVFARSRRSPFVVAGDLNITTQIAYDGQTQAETDGAAAVFARLRAWGLTDCLGQAFRGSGSPVGCTCPDGDACSHVQTFRLKNRPDSRATQLDYAFASPPMVSRLVRSRVVHDDAAWQLSDHCPVVLEFYLSKPADHVVGGSETVPRPRFRRAGKRSDASKPTDGSIRDGFAGERSGASCHSIRDDR
jgi:hypothetical protein